MPDQLKPDICIIGAGTAGMRAALQAVAFGVRPVLIDVGGDPAARMHDAGRMGSDALRAGRLPLAALTAAARRAHAAARSDAFGLPGHAVEIDFARVRGYVQGVIAARAPNFARERLAALGVRVIEGAARFKDPGTLLAGDVEIAARRFVIATGSTSALPPIAGLDGAPHLTTETVFDLTACPAHLIVIGAGAAALEFAQAFRRLGAGVTVLDAEGPLRLEDPECSAVLLDQLAREGVEIRVGTITRVDEAPPHSKWKVQVRLSRENGEEVIAASHLLIAGERWANVVGLGLDAAGVKFDEHGVVVDAGLKTSNRRIYAIGDVTGAQVPPHAADHQAGLVVGNALFRQRVRFDAEAITRVILTDPELAQLGLTEAVARQRGHKIRVLRWPYRENDRAQAEGEVRGHVKVVISDRGRILGVTIVGAAAGELIATWALAMARGADIRALAGIVVPYPTLAEIGKNAAATYFMGGLTSSWSRRIIAVLRRFG